MSATDGWTSVPPPPPPRGGYAPGSDGSVLDQPFLDYAPYNQPPVVPEPQGGGFDLYGYIDQSFLGLLPGGVDPGIYPAPFIPRNAAPGDTSPGGWSFNEIREGAADAVHDTASDLLGFDVKYLLWGALGVAGLIGLGVVSNLTDKLGGR